MRLFTGLEVPSEVRRNLELLLHLLRPAADIQWSPLENLHVTTKFIGEWPEGRLDELKQALSEVPCPGELTIDVRGLGWFPNPHVPRIFFAAIPPPPGLVDLAAGTETTLEQLDLASDHREYRPHLTLARIKRPTDLLGLKRTIASLPSVEFGRFRATHFHLYLSRPQGGRSVYTKLASYALAVETRKAAG
jgi:2'-5' RNA ligase